MGGLRSSLEIILAACAVAVVPAAIHAQEHVTLGGRDVVVWSPPLSRSGRQPVLIFSHGFDPGGARDEPRVREPGRSRPTRLRWPLVRRVHGRRVRRRVGVVEDRRREGRARPVAVHAALPRASDVRRVVGSGDVPGRDARLRDYAVASAQWWRVRRIAVTQVFRGFPARGASGVDGPSPRRTRGDQRVRDRVPRPLCARRVPGAAADERVGRRVAAPTRFPSWVAAGNRRPLR